MLNHRTIGIDVGVYWEGATGGLFAMIEQMLVIHMLQVGVIASKHILHHHIAKPNVVYVIESSIITHTSRQAKLQP